MEQFIPLTPGHYYHIYNRGNNRENLFREEENYRYFLKLYLKHIQPTAATIAYCLLPNHFHLVVRIHDDTSQPEQAWSNFFNAYAKAINKRYGRTGSLFETRFRRILVDTEAYFLTLLFYVHFNPQKHGLVADFREWKWSSFAALSGTVPTQVRRDDVWGFFGGRAAFEDFHGGEVDEKLLLGHHGETFEVFETSKV